MTDGQSNKRSRANAGRRAVNCVYDKAWIESPRRKMHGEYAIFVHDEAHMTGDLCIARIYRRSLTPAQLGRIMAAFLEIVNKELGIDKLKQKNKARESQA